MSAPLRVIVPAAFVVVVAATLVGFVLVEDERDHPKIVEDVDVTRAFAPQGRRGLPRVLRVRFTITRAESSATVVVEDDAGRVVATLAAEVALADDGRYAYAWDGRLAAGAPAAPGRYRVHLRLRDLDRDLPLDRSRLIAIGGATGEG